MWIARTLLVGSCMALPLTSGCTGRFEHLLPVPTPETRVVGDVTGVVLRGEAADERVEFIEVRAVNWTSSELVITGRRDEGGIVETASFPLEQIRYVLVRDFSARESLKRPSGPVPS